MQPFDAGMPSIARVYDRWPGGKDNFAGDQAVIDARPAALAGAPHVGGIRSGACR